MYLPPDSFIEKYRKENLPFFKVFKGNSTSENDCMLRFLENPGDLDNKQLIEIGAQMLDDFFKSFTSGNVKVVTKSNASSRNTSSNAINVKWGDNSAQFTRANNSNDPSTNMMNQFKQMEVMFGFFGNIFTKQSELQLKLLENQFNARLQAIEKDREHELEMEQLYADLATPEPTFGQVLSNEAARFIPSVMEAIAAKNGVVVPPRQLATPPSVNGMKKEEENKEEIEEENNGAVVENGGNEKPKIVKQNPMYGMSMDFIMLQIKLFVQEVFPDYHIHESFPATIQKCIEQKALIRAQVEPLILANRAKAKAAKAAKNNSDES